MSQVGIKELTMKIQELTVASTKTGDNEGKNE
jgi:hypothetical protein